MISSQFNYFISAFYIKYIPGNIFVNGIVSGISEISAYFISYSLLQRIGIKRSLILGFVFQCMGSIPMIFVQENSESIPAMILLTRVGGAYI